jgi:hypothetical protein
MQIRNSKSGEEHKIKDREDDSAHEFEGGDKIEEGKEHNTKTESIEAISANEINIHIEDDP